MRRKSETINLKVTKKIKEEVKELARKSGASITDYCLSRILNIPLKETEEVIYTTKVYIPKYSKKLII